MAISVMRGVEVDPLVMMSTVRILRSLTTILFVSFEEYVLRPCYILQVLFPADNNNIF